MYLTIAEEAKSSGGLVLPVRNETWQPVRSQALQEPLYRGQNRSSGTSVQEDRTDLQEPLQDTF
jgi:hypothetical protein